MNTIDLSKCKKGDILISSQGSTLEYICPTPWKHYTYLDHVVRYITDKNGKSMGDENYGTRTNDGFVYAKNRKPETDHDIIGIVKKDNKETGTEQCVIPNVVHHVKITDFIGEKVWFDDDGSGYIWGEKKDGECQMIGEIRGWGAIQNLFKNNDGNIDFKKAEDFQGALGVWIADAIQQKLKKERA